MGLTSEGDILPGHIAIAGGAFVFLPRSAREIRGTRKVGQAGRGAIVIGAGVWGGKDREAYV